MSDQQTNTDTHEDKDTSQIIIPEQEQETCPLCKITGPPSQPGSEPSEVELIWMACTKCDTWYHSACLFLGDEKVRSTVPDEILKEVEGKRKEEGGAWFNWPQWIDRWYCYTCIARASSPSNPRPPRHPLKATLKKGVPPFETSKPKRSASSLSLVQNGQQPKRARTSINGQKRGSTNEQPDQKREHHHHHAGVIEDGASRATPSSTVEGGEGSTNEGRPKRNVKQLDYHNLNNSIATPTNQWLDLISDPGKYGRVILDAEYKSVPGSLLSRSWLDSPSDTKQEYPPTMFYGPEREPIIVRPENGGFTSMGGQIPGKDLTVQDVAKLVGPKRMVDVIDVSSQQSSQWTLQKWADYLHPPSSSSSSSSSTTRKKVYNIISLEISDTELAKKVKPPSIVREIDWVDNYWNFSIGGKGKEKEREKSMSTPIPDEGISINGGDIKENVNGVGANEELEGLKGKTKAPYPKVQLYCLMGMKGAWTDWHVDFAASSVYYTIHTGSKVFYFIRPTTENLKAYASWSGSFERQQDTWLPDMCDEVRKVVLHAGDTMIIPAGYIHAVYTPMDSIVFGGNFIHSYDIDTELRLRQIEIDTKVPQRFRFPMFERLCWFVAERYNSQLRQLRAYRPRSTTPNSTNPLHARVLSQLIHLCDFLLNQISILHNPDKEERSKKLVWDRIPHELIKDPEALARELKWRVLRELGMDDPLKGYLPNGKKVENGHADKGYDDENANEKELKRKKSKLSRVFNKKGASRTWLFDPPKWEESITTPQIESSLITVARPDGHGEEEAEESLSTIKQFRKRSREIEGGGLVLEEQEVVFIEKKTVWGLEGQGQAKMEVD
ncbi:hypothetical protein I203_104970 [Kwoniella mangroviensis CBS 8507]|uniref:uncharacterized protein n=1 Tax=Kwoniella mangroviensis CBS 8507 TaxID=1296122 RepID=UPI0030334CF3